MCYFIAVGVDEKFVDVLRQFKPDLFYLKPNTNQFIRKLIQPGATFWAGVSSLCDCDFYYALAAPTEEGSDEERTTRFRQTRQRRGWSANKIERAVAESRSAQEHGPAGSRARLQALWAAEFLSWMREVVNRAGEVMLLAHSYRGHIEQEEVRIQGHLTVSIAELMKHDRHVEAEQVIRITNRSEYRSSLSRGPEDHRPH